MTEMLSVLKQILELGSPAVYLIILVAVWREYRQTVQLLVQLLREIAKLPKPE